VGIVSRAAPSGVVAKVTLATIVVAPEPLTSYAVARTVEERFGGDHGVLRTRLKHVYAELPRLERAGLIREVGTVRARGTSLLAATQAGVESWRSWLTGPITVPDAMTGALARLKAVRPGDHPTMLKIIDRFEGLLQRMVHQAADPGEPEHIADRMGLLWNKRELVAQLQWCQHARDEVYEAMRDGGR
jgi:DNA-binding PadR family transcriptional regulator